MSVEFLSCQNMNFQNVYGLWEMKRWPFPVLAVPGLCLSLRVFNPLHIQEFPPVLTQLPVSELISSEACLDICTFHRSPEVLHLSLLAHSEPLSSHSALSFRQVKSFSSCSPTPYRQLFNYGNGPRWKLLNLTTELRNIIKFYCVFFFFFLCCFL